MSLGHRIRQLRQTRGFTQSQLGGAELSKSFISLLEKDRTQPSLPTLVLIARRLGTSVDSLLGQNGHIPEMVCEGILALARDALRRRDYATVRTLRDPAAFLATTYGLDEAQRELRLFDGQLALEEQRFDDAAATLTEASAGAEQARDAWRAGRALLLLGMVKVRTRDYLRARQVLEEALAALRRAKAGRDPARAEALITLGTTLGNLGDFAGAIRRFEEAARSDPAQRDPWIRGKALWGIGQAYRKMGQVTAATEYLMQAKDALEAAEEVGDFVRVSKALGQLLHEQGQHREALRHLHHALRASERLGMSVLRASTLTEIARVNLALDNAEDAAHFAQQALDGAAAVNDPVETAEATVVLARIQARRGDAPGAVRLFKDALATFQERKMAPKVADVARELGLLLRARGAHAQAAGYLALSLKERPGGVGEASEAVSESHLGNPLT